MLLLAVLRIGRSVQRCRSGAGARGRRRGRRRALAAAAGCSPALGNSISSSSSCCVVGRCVLAGVPIAFAFGLATFGYLALTTRTPLTVMVGRMDEGMSHLILLSVPLFVFLGLLIEMTGMARAMVGFLASLLGHVRGGLSLRAARRDVSRLRHLGLEGRRHGGGGAGAVPRDEGARRQAGRSRRPARRRPARRPRPSRRASC